MPPALMTEVHAELQESILIDTDTGRSPMLDQDDHHMAEQHPLPIGETAVSFPKTETALADFVAAALIMAKAASRSLAYQNMKPVACRLELPKPEQNGTRSDSKVQD